MGLPSSAALAVGRFFPAPLKGLLKIQRREVRLPPLKRRAEGASLLKEAAAVASPGK